MNQFATQQTVLLNNLNSAKLSAASLNATPITEVNKQILDLETSLNGDQNNLKNHDNQLTIWNTDIQTKKNQLNEGETKKIEHVNKINT